MGHDQPPEPTSLVLSRLLAFLLKLVLALYYFAILSVPELVIGRFLQSLAYNLQDNKERLSKGHITFSSFCNKADVVRLAYGSLSKVCKKYPVCKNIMHCLVN